MEVTKDSTLSPSITSSTYENHDDANTISLKNYLKELLKSRIFLGRYVERRLVDKSIGYRDIVVISNAEVELKNDLIEAQHKLRSIAKVRWVGITDTAILNYKPSGLCLWTEIDNQPFGPFWFQIKTVQVRDDEALVKLKCLRHLSDAYLEAEPILTGGVKVKESRSRKFESNTENLYQSFGEIKGNLSNALTITNVKEFITFMFAIIIAIFSGSSAFIIFLGNFVLALIRETSNLVHNSTPMFLGFLDLCSKVIGGFYILLAMMFKPNQPNPLKRRQISYKTAHDNFDSRDID